MSVHVQEQEGKGDGLRTCASSSEGRNSCLAGIGTGKVYLQSRTEAVRPVVPRDYGDMQPWTSSRPSEAGHVDRPGSHDARTDGMRAWLTSGFGTSVA